MQTSPEIIINDAEKNNILVADELQKIVEENNQKNRLTFAMLATGSTPIGFYEELIRRYKSKQIDLRNLVCFNLDEYCGIPVSSNNSYRSFMNETLFNHTNIDLANTNILQGDLGNKEALQEECKKFRKQIADAGGIDFQILGIGVNGHIGFNEPGTLIDSKTRIVDLAETTRKRASGDFHGIEHTPTQALSVGFNEIGTAKKTILIANGESKRHIIKKTLEGEISIDNPATFLRRPHMAEKTTFYIDYSAAQELESQKYFWKNPEKTKFSESEKRQAVMTIALELNKPVKKLTKQDYEAHQLSKILGATDIKQLNGSVHTYLENQIETNNIQNNTEKQKILFFAPHPDDTPISAGGKFIQLTAHQHEVKDITMTSGNIAVRDTDVLNFLESEQFKEQFDHNAGKITADVHSFLKTKSYKMGDIDSEGIAHIKTVIRKYEEQNAVEAMGSKKENAVFLNLPFYETRTIKKSPPTQTDIDIVKNQLKSEQPTTIYIADDLNDPHGTHRVCYQIIFEALDQLKPGGGVVPEVRGYRGAWQEYAPHESDTATVLSEEEMDRKLKAIRAHKSQLPGLFQGTDFRTFDERVIDRNRHTAQQFNTLLGTDKYQYMELYRKIR